MANPLEVGNVSPPAPGQDQGNALQQGGGGPQNPQAPAQQVPPPTHAQTVAAMRHFDAINDELTGLLKNPTLGKSSLKSSIIDSVTRLVAERMIKPAEAVMQLSSVPENPIEQRKWLQNMFMQNKNAERGIIAHHAVGFAGQGPEPSPSSDDHMQHVGELMANYGGKK